MNPGRPMTIFDVPQIVVKCLEIGATEQNIRSGFAKSGIWPLDSDIFEHSDFLPFTVTDRPESRQLPEVMAFLNLRKISLNHLKHLF